MKKTVSSILLVAMFLLPMAAKASVNYMQGVNDKKEPIVSLLLSSSMPGMGEWYNSNWQGSFPWAECILGYICCFVQISSVLDAVNGNTDKDVRLDFWTAPAR